MADDWKISKSAVIVLIILGCFCAVLIGYSMHRMIGGKSFKTDEEELPGAGQEQRAYMREIRQANLKMLYYESRQRDKM